MKSAGTPAPSQPSFFLLGIDFFLTFLQSDRLNGYVGTCGNNTATIPGSPRWGDVRKLPPILHSLAGVACGSSTSPRRGNVHDKLVELLPCVYRFAMRLCGDSHLAEDLAQEAILRALRSWTKLSDERALRVWLFRITTNIWLDYCRRKKRNPDAGHDGAELAACPQLDPAARAAVNEAVEIAMKLMNQLPPRQRSVLHLVACEQLSHAEVARVLNITSQAVKANLSLARAQMRTMFSKIDL